ncbi:protealysin inhibitor emfourin [Microbacterium sp.]|uniref:protealysin inhibitor emfourin n=1 Tax=Microbacterium sp. TaxID=51671 RepID=UPI00281287B7|nr:protealysin inhibitor emfourin [Microbacterium sp.]
MPEHENSADSAADASGGESTRVLIIVVRSGGFAGISRRWRVEPDPAEEPRWTTLVERCPWDAPPEHPDAGADRFIWTVHARVPDADLQRELPDSELTGAWRELVEAVREAGSRDDDPRASRGGPFAEPADPGN